LLALRTPAALLALRTPAALLALRTPTRPALFGRALVLLFVDDILELVRSLIDLTGVAELLTGQVGKLVDPLLNLIAVLAE
jgi:hypothetical protein